MGINKSMDHRELLACHELDHLWCLVMLSDIEEDQKKRMHGAITRVRSLIHLMKRAGWNQAGDHEINKSLVNVD